MNLWLISRGAGLSALVLLTLSTSLGALVSVRGRASVRYVVQYLHRVFAGLGLGVLGLHIGTVIADSYAHVGWSGAIIPFTAGYRPTAVAVGTLAAYTFGIVAILGVARARMASSVRATRVWRALHGLAYAGWGAALWHGVMSGTDTSVSWVRYLYVACVMAVVGALATRLPHLRATRLQGALR